jgi:hypothetical protein
MKKRVLTVLVVVLVLAATASVVWAGEGDGDEYTYNIVKDGHKVRNKWDLSGDFVAHPGYNWGGLAEGATWTYRIHIKEAMDGNFSVGSIHFMTGDIDVVGHVEATRRDYPYWSGDDLAAVGTAQYNDTTYYFMFLYAERAVWFALNDASYDSEWALGTVWLPRSSRDYELHSRVPDETFTVDYKEIH